MKKIMLVVLSLVLGLAFFPTMHSFADDLTGQKIEIVEQELSQTMVYNQPSVLTNSKVYYANTPIGEPITLTTIGESGRDIWYNSDDSIVLFSNDGYALDELTISTTLTLTNTWLAARIMIIFGDADNNYLTSESIIADNLPDTGEFSFDDTVTIPENATQFYVDIMLRADSVYTSEEKLVSDPTVATVDNLFVNDYDYQNNRFYNTSTGTLINLLPFLFIVLLVGSAVIFIPRN